MTRFVGDAIAQRTSKRKMPSAKEMRKDMQKFLETGEHPELQQDKDKDVLQPLPARDPTRPHVFMELRADGRGSLGRLVIELFEDEVPLAAAEFRKRCSPGSTGGYVGTRVHKLLHNLAVYGGRSPKYQSGGLQLKPNPRVQHLEKGLVSISLDGAEFVLPMARALIMDKTHQVVGRIVHGAEVLDVLNDLPTNVDDTPRPPVTVARVGHADGRAPETAGAEGEGGAGESAEDAAAKVKAAAAATRAAVKDALASGMKRKELDGGGAGAGSGKPGPAAKAARRGGMMDDLLGGEDSSSSDDDDEGGD